MVIGGTVDEFEAGRRDLHLLLNIQTCSGTHPAFYFMGTGALSPGWGGGGRTKWAEV